MIVFWRLVLAYYIGAVLFFNPRCLAFQHKRPFLSHAVQAGTFLAIAGVLCRYYLLTPWPLAEQWPLPGWLVLPILTLWYILLRFLFTFRPNQTHGFTRLFLLHEIAMLGALFACAPLQTVYHTGNIMAEPTVLFLVGVLAVTKMFSIAIFCVEADVYGRDYPTLDESFITMLMRLIFFLMVLLPGWRWLVWFVIWFWACAVARRNRLMDISTFAFYFSVFGAAAVGFAVRFSWYW